MEHCTKNEQVTHTCNNTDKSQKHYARPEKMTYLYDYIFKECLQKTNLCRCKEASGCRGPGEEARIDTDGYRKLWRAIKSSKTVLL